MRALTALCIPDLGNGAPLQTAAQGRRRGQGHPRRSTPCSPVWVMRTQRASSVPRMRTRAAVVRILKEEHNQIALDYNLQNDRVNQYKRYPFGACVYVCMIVCRGSRQCSDAGPRGSSRGSAAVVRPGWRSSGRCRAACCAWDSACRRRCRGRASGSARPATY
jgi:hypothetical protein